MEIYADYHTHTTYSHGKGSIEDNVKIAVAKGLKEIAISDHGPGHMGFGIKASKYAEMRQVIDDLKPKYPQITILLGLEANILDEHGNVDVDDALMQYNDILLAGYHFGSAPKESLLDSKIHLFNFMSRKSEYYFKKARELNTKAFINAVNKYPIKALTHPGAKGPLFLEEVAKVATARGTALEINNSHGHLTLENIELVKGSGCQFLISSDAHVPENVGNFSKAIERALACGLTPDRIINAVK